MRRALLLFLLLAAPAHADALDALVRAYPDFLAGHDATTLLWRDGTRTPLDDGWKDKTETEALLHGSLLDQLRIPYPVSMAVPLDDPGRIRNRAFFDLMFGDCRRGEVAPHLVPVTWLPRAWGRKVMITAVNGVAEKLAAVSAEIDAMPPEVSRYAWPPAGTYVCRPVADSGQASMHGWGAAIDIATAKSDYWLWRRNGEYRNRIPPEIVAAFERHGFIWGGKWRHYDTMHFEYRPELLAPAATAAR